MKDLTLSQQYALLALDGQESIHPSVAKSAVLRAVSAAQVLETELGKADADSFSEFSAELQRAVQTAKTLKKKEETQIEKEVAAVLEAEELLKEVPDILGCDMNYDTSGVELKAYLSDETSYIRIKEGLRAEILEDGPISLEDAVLLWLLRESGCIHDLFSVSEQNRVEERMTEAAVQDEKYRALWEAEFHNVFEGFMNRFVKTKSKLLKNCLLKFSPSPVFATTGLLWLLLTSHHSLLLTDFILCFHPLTRPPLVPHVSFSPYICHIYYC